MIGIIINQLAMGRIAILFWLWICVALHCGEALQYPFGNGMKDDYLIRAEKLMKKTPVIDGHNVIPFRMVLTVGFTYGAAIFK